MNDNPKAKKAPQWLWLAVLPGLVLVVMEILEPLLFEGEKYDAWRIVKLVGLCSYAAIVAIEWRKLRR